MIHELGKPCTPSVIEGHNKRQATLIKISFGGGLGGANKTIYSVSEKDNNHITHEGKKIFINPDYIVYKEYVTLVTLTTKVDNHSYYKGVTKIEETFALEEGDSYIINYQRYTSRTDSRIKLISKTEY